MLGVVHVVLMSESAIFREGLAHLLAGTRFRTRTHSLPLTELDSELSGTDQILFMLSVGAHEPCLSGPVGRIRTVFPSAKIVILATTTHVNVMLEAIQLGVSGYMAENVTADSLFKSLDIIMADGVVFPSASLLHFRPLPAEPVIELESSSRGRPLGQEGSHQPDLSCREISILQALTLGDSNKIIARKLQIAEATVKAHVKSILRKVRVQNRTQAAIWATCNGVSLGDLGAMPVSVRSERIAMNA